MPQFLQSEVPRQADSVLIGIMLPQREMGLESGAMAHLLHSLSLMNCGMSGGYGSTVTFDFEVHA
jgi:hypothetical protein